MGARQLSTENRKDAGRRMLIAFKAIMLAPGLSAAEMRVAAAILDHHNHRTGQCDPSVGRLARLLDISERKVRIATRKLSTGDNRLFDKAVHGGHAGRSSFRPRWHRFEAIANDWQARMTARSEPDEAPPEDAQSAHDAAEDPDAYRNKSAGASGTEVPVHPEQKCLQTYRTNQSKEPEELGAHAGSTLLTAEPSGKRRKALEGGKPDPQRSLLMPLKGGKSISRQDAAEAASHRRQTKAIASLRTVEERQRAWLEAMRDPCAAIGGRGPPD